MTDNKKHNSSNNIHSINGQAELLKRKQKRFFDLLDHCETVNLTLNEDFTSYQYSRDNKGKLKFNCNNCNGKVEYKSTIRINDVREHGCNKIDQSKQVKVKS